MTVPTEAPAKPVVVVSTSKMIREDFCLHMSRRHGDSLGGLEELRPGDLNEYTEGLWRAFHKRLHEVRRYDHEHGR